MIRFTNAQADEMQAASRWYLEDQESGFRDISSAWRCIDRVEVEAVCEGERAAALLSLEVSKSPTYIINTIRPR